MYVCMYVCMYVDRFYPQESSFRRIVLELADCTLEPKDYSRHYGEFDQSLILRFTCHLISAIAHMHAHKIIHRDIKPVNLLYFHSTKTLKVTDFGISCPMVREYGYTSDMVTLWYRAPEILWTGGWYGSGVDLFAAAVVVLEWMKGRPFFPCDTSIGVLQRQSYFITPFQLERFDRHTKKCYKEMSIDLGKGERRNEMLKMIDDKCKPVKAALLVSSILHILINHKTYI